MPRLFLLCSFSTYACQSRRRFRHLPLPSARHRSSRLHQFHVTPLTHISQAPSQASHPTHSSPKPQNKNRKPPFRERKDTLPSFPPNPHVGTPTPHIKHQSIPAPQSLARTRAGHLQTETPSLFSMASSAAWRFSTGSTSSAMNSSTCSGARPTKSIGSTSASSSSWIW